MRIGTDSGIEQNEKQLYRSRPFNLYIAASASMTGAIKSTNKTGPMKKSIEFHILKLTHSRLNSSKVVPLTLFM